MKKIAAAALAAMTALGLAACATPTSTPSGAATSNTVTVVTHDSFNLSDSVKATFKEQTGYDLKLVSQGDGGQLVNQLILTKDAPLGDAVFGIDNTFAGRALSAGILAPHYSTKLPEDSSDLLADGNGALTPIDFADVCVNADKAWFAEKNLAIPVTLDDLTKPEYRDLLVTPDAASSSPGLAFLVGTVGAKGADGYLDYWKQLRDNGVKVVKGWTEAYNLEFSAGEGRGSRPLVVSYSTSPAFTVPEGASESTTTALLDTCFRQVEYAGVLTGAANEAGAKAFVDWMLSPQVQADIPGQMYMYPAVRSTELPAEWVKHAPLSPNPFSVPAAEIAANRETWVKDWTATVIG